MRLDKYTWTTGGGKVISLYRNTNGSLRLGFVEGGETPKEFDQTFTDIKNAELAATRYLENHKPRKLKNGSTGGEQAL